MTTQVNVDANSSTGFGVGPKGAVTFATTGKAARVPQSDDEVKRAADGDISRSPLNTIAWGSNNRWPQEASDIIDGNDILFRIMEARRAIHYGKGIVVYKEYVSDGKRVQEPVFIPEIEDWLELNQVNDKYLPESIGDYEAFKIIFPQMCLSRDRTKINRIFHRKATSCRFQKANTSTNLVENIIFNNMWDKAPTDETSLIIPALDPYYPLEHIQNSNELNFIYPIALPHRKNIYYPVPCWYSAVTNGWVDISNSVPKTKNAIFQNQMIIKYHVEIPYSYWPKKYHDWEAKAELQATRMTTEYTNMTNFLCGQENAGKTFFSGYGMDPVTQKEFPGWRITAVDDKLKEGAFIPDSQEAAQHIMFAGGMDPSIIGVSAPGGKLGAGSGSDKRESMYIHQAQIGIDHTITLSVLNFIKNYNNWNQYVDLKSERLRIGIEQIDTSQTLDKNPNGKQNVIAQ